MRRAGSPKGHTDQVTESQVSYGRGVPDEGRLRLLGDISGKRVIELGIRGNALHLAAQGAKSIALDPDPDRIADLRAAAARSELTVECHHGDLADLGFAPSGTIEAVVASHSLDDEPDLARVLRQVHRVLRGSGVFVIAVAHPFAAVAAGSVARYGDGHRTIGDLLGALERTNFRIEAFHELGLDDDHTVPTTLVVKTRKEGS